MLFSFSLHFHSSHYIPAGVVHWRFLYFAPIHTFFSCMGSVLDLRLCSALKQFPPTPLTAAFGRPLAWDAAFQLGSLDILANWWSAVVYTYTLSNYSKARLAYLCVSLALFFGNLEHSFLLLCEVWLVDGYAWNFTRFIGL
jgi:hypothetical protein